MSLDWLLTLRTQLSTSKPSDNPGLKKDTTPFRVVPPRFENGSCVTRNFDKGRKAITSTISLTGHLSPNTAQCSRHGREQL